MKLSIFFASAALLLAAGCVKSPNEAKKENRPPQITRVEVANSAIRVGQSTTITCRAIDPDNDELTYKWETANGMGYILGSGATVTYATSACCAGANQIKVTVADPKGASDSKPANVDVRP
ncbi:MAG: Ig-like domain-containing protein [bacterium]